jgi:phage FluMu gp28-like protein
MSRSTRKRVQEIERKIKQLTEKPPALPNDPIEFCEKILGFTPTEYQKRLFQSDSKRIILRWARQSGKTKTIAARGIIQASLHPRSLILVIAPGLRQSLIVGSHVQELLRAMPREHRRSTVRQQLKTKFRFRNGSEILILPNSENQLRGFAAHLIIADEAAFFRNDEVIFENVLPPMLATTGGTLIASSTPWGKNTVFYRLNQDPDYEKHVVTWRQAAKEGVYHTGFIDQIEKTRETRPQVYRMEYEAEFIEEIDTWLDQDLLAKSCSEELEYLPFDSRQTGIFYMGVDLAERVDYSVIAILRKNEERLDLVHMHRFKKGTSIASVIGYAKILTERWSRIIATYVDKTKHGDYVVNDFQEAGVARPTGINFTQDTKQEMAQILKQRMTEGILQLPFDRDTLDELNIEKYELTKTGRITFSHPEGTHDDRFWALALAAYAAEQAPPPSIPIARAV